MHVSAASNNVAAQFQSSAARKVDVESKVEGNKPDADNDADDKVGAAQSATSAPAATGSIGQNINLVA